MRTFDLAPLYRSTVGFDRLFSLFDQLGDNGSPGYPPYNIERTGENDYRITVAVAGFAEPELSIEVKENALTIRGDKQTKTDEQKGVLQLVFAQQAISRPILAPPGVPADRLAALRQAFQATMQDKEFLAEADKQGLDISPSTAEEIDVQLKRLYSMPEAIVKKALEVSTK